MINDFENELSGGHHNSLGNTDNVARQVLEDKRKLQDVFDCYKSKDEVVRLRTSSVIKRLCKERPKWVAEHADDLLGFVSEIDQPSTKWTLATIFMWLDDYLTEQQRKAAIKTMKTNIQSENDWIVQNTTMESLLYYSKKYDSLKLFLVQQLTKNVADPRKSVARRAEKYLKELL